MDDDDDLDNFKIVVIGSSGTGKSNILTRYSKNQFSESTKATVGVQFFTKIVKVRDQKFKIALWDTAGQEKYKSLSKVYYKGAAGVLILYDITDPQTYLDVQSWMRLAGEILDINEVAIMIVGNKVDLEDERKVPKQRAVRQYKDKFDIDCFEVSAKTGYNVNEVFTELVEKIYQMNMVSVLAPQEDDPHVSIVPSDNGQPPPPPIQSKIKNTMTLVKPVKKKPAKKQECC